MGIFAINLGQVIIIPALKTSMIRKCSRHLYSEVQSRISTLILLLFVYNNQKYFQGICADFCSSIVGLTSEWEFLQIQADFQKPYNKCPSNFINSNCCRFDLFYMDFCYVPFTIFGFPLNYSSEKEFWTSFEHFCTF